MQNFSEISQQQKTLTSSTVYNKHISENIIIGMNGSNRATKRLR